MKQDITKFLKTFVSRFLAVFFVFACFLVTLEYNAIVNEKDKANIVLNNTLSRIQIILNELIDKTNTLEAYVHSKGEEQMKELQNDPFNQSIMGDFNLLASSIFAQEGVRALQLLPNGIMTYTYPYKSNAKAIGDRVLERADARDGAIKARDSGQIVVTVPKELVQGGKAIIVRNPIYYKDGTFWGFSAIVFDVPSVFVPLGLSNLTNRGYEYDLSLYDDNDVEYKVGSTLTHDIADTQCKKVFIFDKYWVLRIIPKDNWFSVEKIFLEILFIICLSLFIAYLLTKEKLGQIYLQESLNREKHLREVASDAYKAIDDANKAKTRFLSSISHDLRTPMNAIVGLGTLIQRDYQKADKVQYYSTKIISTSHHLLSLINDILDMSKIESGKATLNYQEFLLGDFVEEINAIVGQQTNAKHQSFEIVTKDIRHENIIADKLRINQIMLNLLSNSVKYTKDEGSIKFTITELKDSSQNTSLFRFEVIDNGMGISKEYIEHIFEPFTRDRASKVYKIQGTGLGMAITKNLVNLMGGSIVIESEEGKGTKITVELPLKIKQQNEDNKNFFKENGITRMLVIDDDPSACTAILTAMAGTAVDVQYAQSGKSALEMIQNAHENNRPFDIILLDWWMPEMNGLEVAREIKKDILKGLMNDVPILIYTENDYFNIQDEAIELGITDFMAKPFFLSNFKRIVASLKDNHQGHKKRSSLDGLNILAAEDNELNAEILFELLLTKGASCKICKDGVEVVNAFSKARDDEYDLILMDVQMPKLNGLEATKAIRDLNKVNAKTIPIIAMTANAFSDDVKLSLDAGMNYHLSKPINMQELEKVVAKFVSRSGDNATFISTKTKNITCNIK